MRLLNDCKAAKPCMNSLYLQMPRMNGEGFLTKIRQDSRYRYRVIFVLTTTEDDQDIYQSYQLNVIGFFVKYSSRKAFLDIFDLLNGDWGVAHLPRELS